ncbi:hypothetical protein [Polyangium sp. 6x1]|uniref:hypothetical protein n=1 Tax=Polyangium sp. 6x1 TaxID=3042689 RepID=UPI002482FEFF|nr:hypothetical protein [Polyangium sp. 6x1]MDI1451609.1 hypothetical protein [Polyangium sp. 6x1]
MNAHRFALPLLGGVALSFVVGCGSSSGDLGLGNGGSSSSASSASGGSGGAGGAAGTGGSSGDGGSGNGGGNGGSGGDAGAGGGGTTEKFSFFVTSLRALQELSGNPEGFGGDLRFGETGPGSGLRGADKICATIAEKSMPGAGQKPWRAFLSAAAGEDGQQVDAKDRIGEGPWYDRLGRLLAANKTDLLKERPAGADAAIINDFPNEDGVPNHQPDPNQGEVDNHDMLTGTNAQGTLYAATATCKDWTSNLGDLASEGKPRVGHSWPRFGGGGGPGPGGGDGSMANWMSSLTESGCAPGVNLIEMGGPLPGSVTVGSGGGYGGFYCFSLVP